MEQLLEKTAQIQKIMAEAAAEPDMEKVIAIALRAEAEAKALEQMGEVYRKQELKRRGRGEIEVVLTVEQRRRIHDKTGIAMESIIIEDELGVMNQNMPSQDPEYIEELALQEAMRRQHAAEADRLVRAELDRSVAAIEAFGIAELSEQLQRILADPKFFGGLLSKK